MATVQEGGDLVIKCILLAGRLMMESGAETYRVEDTMLRMARSQQLNEAQTYATPTGIIFSLGSTQPTTIVSIANRTTDLHKIALVNAVSRKLTSGQCTLVEAYQQLIEIEQTNYFLPISLQIIASAIASASFMVLFNGLWRDVPVVMIIGGIGYFVVLMAHRLTHVKFFSEFVAASIVGILSIFFVHIGWGTSFDNIIIGAVMPLVPGVAITNAVRDLMAGHFTAGTAKGAEALLTALAIGSGVAVVLSF